MSPKITAQKPFSASDKQFEKILGKNPFTVFKKSHIFHPERHPRNGTAEHLFYDARQLATGIVALRSYHKNRGHYDLRLSGCFGLYPMEILEDIKSQNWWPNINQNFITIFPDRDLLQTISPYFTETVSTPQIRVRRTSYHTAG